MEKIGNVKFTGTFDIKEVSNIMRLYKDGSLKLGDAIWEIIRSSK